MFPVFTIYFHHSKEVFVCCLIVSLRCVFWVGLSIRGAAIPPSGLSAGSGAYPDCRHAHHLDRPGFCRGHGTSKNGDITVKAGDTEGTNKVSQGTIIDKEDTNTVITNQNKDTASSNTVTIEAEDEGDKVEVTLKDLNIDTSRGSEAAVSVTGEGNTNIELDGDNALKSDIYSSGISSSGSLTISGGENDSLTAQGGSGADGSTAAAASPSPAVRSPPMAAAAKTATAATASASAAAASPSPAVRSLPTAGGKAAQDSGGGGIGIHSGSLTIYGGTVTPMAATAAM